jgi:uncharacterized OsmC-like protein
MTSTVLYEGDLRTVCTHLLSNSAIETDAPVDNNGKGERFSPTDLIATSLATCMITVMALKANTMDIDLKGIKTEVEKNMKQDPRRIGGINITFSIPDSLSELDEKSKSILKHTAVTCPVQHSLHPEIEVKLDWGSWE